MFVSDLGRLVKMALITVRSFQIRFTLAFWTSFPTCLRVCWKIKSWEVPSGSSLVRSSGCAVLTSNVCTRSHNLCTSADIFVSVYCRPDPLSYSGRCGPYMAYCARHHHWVRCIECSREHSCSPFVMLCYLISIWQRIPRFVFPH